VPELSQVRALSVELSPQPNSEYQRRARILGEVWAVKMLCGRVDGGWHDLTTIYDPAIRHHRIKVFYNTLADPIGYVVWAHLASDVEHRWMSTGVLGLHLSEWNEGDRLWLVDGMVAPGYVSGAIDVALSSLFPEARSVRLASRRMGKLIFKDLHRELFETAARQLGSRGN
jgi:hemolysin-activating ACP:hemolysin acyltransferase